MKKIGLLLAILSFCTACTRLKTYLEVEKIQKNYFKKQAIQKEDSVFGKWNDINCLKADNDTLYLSCRPRYQAEDMYNPPMINVRVAPNKVITYLEISCDSMYNKQPYFTIVGYYGKYQKEGIWAYSKANKYRQGKTYIAKYETYRHGKLDGWAVVYDTAHQIIDKSYFIKGTGFQKNYDNSYNYSFHLKSKGWLWHGKRVGKWYFYDTNSHLDSVNVYHKGKINYQKF